MCKFLLFFLGRGEKIGRGKGGGLTEHIGGTNNASDDLNFNLKEAHLKIKIS